MVNSNADIARARSRGRHHPVIALWKVDLKQPMKEAVKNKGIRKVDDFTKSYTIVDIDFDNQTTNDIDVFFNINKPEDLEKVLNQGIANKENITVKKLEEHYDHNI